MTDNHILAGTHDVGKLIAERDALRGEVTEARQQVIDLRAKVIKLEACATYGAELKRVQAHNARLRVATLQAADLLWGMTIVGYDLKDKGKVLADVAKAYSILAAQALADTAPGGEGDGQQG